MKVKIKEAIHELQVTHVTLSHDLDDIECTKMYMFFCPRCQNPLVQYQGYVVSIMPGKSPIPLPVYIKCPNCKNLYSFNALI